MIDRTRRESELKRKCHEDMMLAMQEALEKTQAELTALKNAPTAAPAAVTDTPAVSLPPAVSAITVSVTPTVPAATASTDVSMGQHITTSGA